MLKIHESNENLHTWLEMNLFTEETKLRIEDADLILVPDIGKIDGIPKAFKPDTKTFYKFIIANNPSEMKIEILENEGDLNILNFHSHELWLPNLYIKDVKLLPKVMEEVNDFVSEKQKRNDNNLVVNFSLKIQKQDGTCITLSFKGGIDDLNKSIESLDIKILLI
jgi:hypothetical protein